MLARIQRPSPHTLSPAGRVARRRTVSNLVPKRVTSRWSPTLQSYNDQQPIALDEVIGVLRRRWLLIAASILVVTGVAVGYAQYRSSQVVTKYAATVQLAPNPDRGAGVGTIQQIDFTALEQLALVLESGDLGQTARDALDDHAGVGFDASVDDTIGLLRLRAVSEDPARSEQVVEVYAQTVIDATAEEDRAQYESRIAAQQAAVDQALSAVDAAQFALVGDPENGRLQAELDSALAGYRSALDTLRAIEAQGLPEPKYTTLSRSDASEVGVGGFTGLGLPTQLILGLVLGGLLGIGLAYLRDALDRRIGSADAASTAYSLPVIAEVPDGGKAFSKGDSLAPPGSLITEAYRRLRTIVQLERDSRTDVDGGYVVLVVSASPEEGKSTSVAHLARSLAEIGNRVLCVSADFRRPKLHRIFGMPAHIGIAGLNDPDERIDPAELIQKTPIEGVSLVAAGRGRSDPTELLRAAGKLIAVARAHFDYIIVDSSPVLSANDTLDLVRSADSVVAVARYKQTTRASAERTHETLAQAGAPLLGVALTAVRGGEGYGYYYGYYSPDTDEESVR